MKYLQRLARRLTGAAPENSLRPNVRRWSDGPDPFENWTIAPATIPLTSKRQPEMQSATPGDKAKLEPNRQPITRNENPAKKTRPVSIAEKLESIESNPAIANREEKFVKHSGLPNLAKTPGQEDLTKPESVSRRSERLQTVRKRDGAESESADAGTISKKAGSKLFGRLRQKVSIGRQVQNFSILTGKPGAERDGVASVGTPVALMQPAYATTSPKKAAGRKKAMASRAEAPRLIIGNLKVDVVAVDDKQKPRHIGAAPARKKKSTRARDIGRVATKMKFGLGQM